MLSTDYPVDLPRALDLGRTATFLPMLAAERMRRSFVEFAKRAWLIVEPKQLAWNWHLDCISEHLVLVTQRDIRNLMINIPPRQTKSILVSVLWPVWHWIQNPETQFLFASYDQALVERDAGNARRLIESTWFRDRYGGEFYLLPSDNRKEMYRNNCGGYRLSTSVNGRATGEGGDIQCFPAGTMVLTEKGLLPIECLDGNKSLIKSWNGVATRWSRQIGFHRTRVRKLLRVRVGGIEIESTPEHPFFVKGKGWIKAENLKNGDCLYASTESNMRSMRSEVLSASGPRSSRQDRHVLLSSMLWNFRARRKKSIRAVYRWINQTLRGMWEANSWKTIGWEARWATDLFHLVSDGFEEASWSLASSLCVRSLSDHFQSEIRSSSKEMLFIGMRGNSSQQENERQRQWPLRGWQGREAVHTFSPFDKEENSQSRALSMPLVFDEGSGSRAKPGCASRQLCEDRSPRRKSSSTVQVLSRENAWKEEPTSGVDEVLVESIEWIDKEAEVFCIDVENDHNFFANGILVHNCLDDPHNAQKVESTKVRLSALSWNDNAWRSRNNDPNKSQKVYVGQRSHDSDLFGHTLQLERKRWVVVALPMEFEVSNRCITYLNDGTGDNLKKEIFRDPRKKESELLNPSRFNVETVKNEKKAMSDRAWNAQYQQRPEGQQGLILKRNWWRQWVWPEWHKEAGRTRPLPDFFEMIQVYDTALEEGEENDYTARTTWGFFEHQDSIEDIKTGKIVEGETRVCALLLDRYKDRPSFPELRKLAAESADRTGPDKILIEKKVSGHSLIQELRRKRLPVVGVKVVGDLTFRAHMASLVLEKGCIFYIPRIWAFDVIEEAAKFPLGDHDDQVSTLVMAWQYMRRYHDLMLPDEKQTDTIDPFRWKKVTYA